MKDYVIFTDSSADIDSNTLSELGVESASLTFKFSDSDKEYHNGEIDSKRFYDAMRNGRHAKTSAVNSYVFREKFSKILNTGRDILYLGFSSGLSATFSSAKCAADMLMRENPGRKITYIDTRSASAGLGLIVYLTAKKKKDGMDIEEAEKYALSLVKSIQHWFTVDDLVYLKRGGRISPATAFFGNMLGIKPILYMDSAGHLKSYSKARGRRGAIEALSDKYGELAADRAGGTVFISHADANEDAELLKRMLAERYGAKVKYTADIGSVIGSHSGPGTLALFFLGK